MTVNAYRLYRKRKRGETAFYDGQESPVTDFDLLLASALCLILLAACVFEWFFAA